MKNHRQPLFVIAETEFLDTILSRSHNVTISLMSVFLFKVFEARVSEFRVSISNKMEKQTIIEMEYLNCN